MLTNPKEHRIFSVHLIQLVMTSFWPQLGRFNDKHPFKIYEKDESDKKWVCNLKIEEDDDDENCYLNNIETSKVSNIFLITKPKNNKIEVSSKFNNGGVAESRIAKVEKYGHALKYSGV